MPSSLSYEMLVKSSNQEASKSTINSVESNFASPFEEGDYIIVPQKHFNVDTKVNGETRVSSRFVAVNLANNYARTVKVSQLKGSISIVGRELPEFTENDCEMRNGVRRLKQGKLPSPTRACRDLLPLVVEDVTVKNTSPWIMRVSKTIDGYNPSYSQRPDGNWDITLDKAGNVAFNSAKLMTFNAVRDIKDADVKKAEKIILADDQLKNLYVAL